MSLKIITFANNKGGVSKTTSTASIGACMARMGKKVLLIDLDGQANLTLYFIPNEDEVQASIFDSLVDGAPLPVKHIRENLDLVPSSLEMASAEIALTNLLAREQLLSRLLEPVKSRYETITMKTRIRENIALAESAGSGQSIFEYDPQSNGAKDYQALTEEIISRNQ